MLLNNEWVNNEIKGEMKKYLETNENEHTSTQNLWDTANSPERGIHSITCLPKEDRKIIVCRKKYSALSLEIF